MVVGLWKPMKKGSKLASTLIVLLFIFLFLSSLVLAGWIDLSNYSKYYYSQICTKKAAKAVEFPIDCSSWNQTKTCPKQNPTPQPCPESVPGSCPEYFRWIHEDLRHWRETGITEEMVEKGRRTAHFRLTILEGKMYMEKFRQSIQTRDLFTIWGLVQLMRWYPGQLPDLELMFDCDDHPVVAADEIGRDPPPLFRYCSDSRSLDIVFPDWSFWGWYKIYIEGAAWSVSEKYILACNSPTLLMTLRWYDFFVRGMIPQRHYIPVKENDKCRTLKFAVEWGNNHTAKAKAIGEAGSRFIHEELKMEYVYDYIFHLLTEYAKLMKYKPRIPPNAVELCSESLACPADGNWRKFMEESLEKSASGSLPCTLPPPYDPQNLKAFLDEKAKAMEEVEAWEDEYWSKQNQEQR